MDKGTDAKKMLLGEDISLKYGYVGVKNRSQKDINNNVLVSDALKVKCIFTFFNFYFRMRKNIFITIMCIDQ